MNCMVYRKYEQGFSNFGLICVYTSLIDVASPTYFSCMRPRNGSKPISTEMRCQKSVYTVNNLFRPTRWRMNKEFALKNGTIVWRELVPDRF